MVRPEFFSDSELRAYLTAHKGTGPVVPFLPVGHFISIYTRRIHDLSSA